MGRVMTDMAAEQPRARFLLPGVLEATRRTNAAIPGVIDGATLEVLVRAYRARGEAMPVRDAVHHVLKTCDALDPIHASGRVHGDIKPANLLLQCAPGCEPDIVLLDGGVTSLVDARGRKRKSIGLTLCSAAYMSPEQLLEPREDARTDIWSLGVVFYQLLTNELPFRSTRTSEIASLVLRRDPQPPGQIRAGIPEPVDRIVMRCLEKNPRHRFQSTRELAAALLEMPGGPLRV